MQIILSSGVVIEFFGEHMPEKETENRHYYKTDEGVILYFRKNHMAAVVPAFSGTKIKRLTE